MDGVVRNGAFRDLCLHVSCKLLNQNFSCFNFVNLILSHNMCFTTQTWVQYRQKNMLKVVVYVYWLKLNFTYQQMSFFNPTLQK